MSNSVFCEKIFSAPKATGDPCPGTWVFSGLLSLLDPQIAIFELNRFEFGAKNCVSL